MEFFASATGQLPYPYQQRLAEQKAESSLIRIPTGCGKTAAVVLAWLWRCKIDRENTPRRLIYCLPMRVLVEQTRNAILKWLQALALSKNVAVSVLMGGEDPDNWDLYPERDTILIGTQDMLLSRALNRGYGMSRARWPMAFGLLNVDSLWVFDEVQLMGSGLATTAQLQAFRLILGNGEADSPAFQRSFCWWLSATMQQNWLKTVDFDPASLRILELQTEDFANEQIKQRRNAKKSLSKAAAAISDSDKLAARIIEEHRKSKGRTLAVMNTVKSARELFDAIIKQLKHLKNKTQTAQGKSANPESPEIPVMVLLHSRFRPLDRARKMQELIAEPGDTGIICVSTQVVEAGVDISASTLFTQLAPWTSLIQRFGRCNRTGNDANAHVFWVDIELPRDEKKARTVARPYDPAELAEARRHLEKCEDVSSSQLPLVELPFSHTHVIRRKDLIDLFDTTPDLSGNDIDIDRYVRDTEETDVRLFWRVWNGSRPPNDKRWCKAAREEICPASVSEFREFVNAKRGQVWRWDFLDGGWGPVVNNDIYPGQTYLVHADAGGYDSDRGWNPKLSASVMPVSVSAGQFGTLELQGDVSTDDESLSEIGSWQTIAEHTDEVCAEISAIIATLPLGESELTALKQAARWHDWGKAHEVFRNAIPDDAPQSSAFWAKAAGRWKKYSRPHFRHELASALAVLGLRGDFISTELRDLVAFLIAAHHGKVRLSIRSLPGEKRPSKPLRFARGVWDGDLLPCTELGAGITTPEVALSVELMGLGSLPGNQPSWIERILHLRDEIGPIRLAYLEALLRAADMRASEKASRRANRDA